MKKICSKYNDLKVLSCYPKIKDMISFERDLTNKIKFQKVSSNFQNQSKEDIVSIKQNNSK